MNINQTSDILRLSLLLELQTTPKPGCVDRQFEHEDTTFIDFTKSAIAVSRAFEQNHSEKIGELIYKATQEMINSHSGVNTHFGSILLHAPLYKASLKIKEFAVDELIHRADDLVEYSDVEDSINFYNALNIVEIGGLGKRDELDAGSSQAINEVSERGIDFSQLMELSKDQDAIAKELVNSFERTVNGFEFLEQRTINNEELVKTFIYLLQEPDTHVIKTCSKEIANQIADKANKIVKKNYPMREIKKLDDELNKNEISPGTTADILSASIFLRLMKDE